ncbi:hypothetical protein [Rubrimonas cliftonensis]|uniref:Uncharacterized protein n=1 Tax=Rubrimonas cliftonensis TaxID=89524 RepID=A0A1H3VF68_9RHOB|nr:hypothetical protein [Rubrimonas cliftonensis]SDZ73435.1 hypothetical protein SAMN05444370_10145 [Rubrimonas cliftonensis]
MGDKGLQSFDGSTNGYKKDGRGTWRDTGDHSIRHSVDLAEDGSIREHVVHTDKTTGFRDKRGEVYTSDMLQSGDGDAESREERMRRFLEGSDQQEPALRQERDIDL